MTNDNSSHLCQSDKKWLAAGVVSFILVILMIPTVAFKYVSTIDQDTEGSQSSPLFVGREKCKNCHKTEYDKWQDSHHDKAMDVATDNSVLGDFNNVSLEHNGITSRFFKRDDKFFINTLGPDGRLTDFEITHTFGFHPLQQYLVPFPNGRYQCLTIAWDNIKKQWYPLPNHTDDYKDWLHWTKGGQNWNGMCAECHSTNLIKGYDITTDSFETTWSEIDVSCEACHGPASSHVAWAEQPALARKQNDNYALVVTTEDIDSKRMNEICARCHSRRTSIGDHSFSHKNMMDYIVPSLLTSELYYPDGQIKDEVYVYGSFTQSKMFSRNIRCNDCHDVHSLQLRQKDNQLCLNCHRGDTYDTKKHHFHKKTHNGQESLGDDCIKCHMPETVYMGIDLRADHSIRIPRPDLSKKYNIPNACNAAGCHADKSVDWTISYMEKWYGLKTRPDFAGVFSKGRAADPEALNGLISLSEDQLLPPIIRATALSLMVSYPVEETFESIKKAFLDQDAQVRRAAIVTSSLLNNGSDASKVIPLLYDPVKAVRIQAAFALADRENLELTNKQQAVLTSVLNEYKEAMMHTADFPHGRYNLGIMYQSLGEPEEAIENYQEAIRIDSRFIPAKNNLAMLFNSRGDNENAARLLRQIVRSNPELHEMAYSLALLLVEEKKYKDALVHLKKAADNLPDRARIHYNLGLLYQILDEQKNAERALLHASSLNPHNFDFLYALADHYLKNNKIKSAVSIAKELQKHYPQHSIGFDIENYAKSLLNR